MGRESVGKIELDMRDMRNSVEQKFESIHQDLRGLTHFLLGIVITFFTTLIGFGGGIVRPMVKASH